MPQDTQEPMGEASAVETAERAFPVVGIGASAGGLEALRELFIAMPVDTGAGFVIVQHLDPTHDSLMTELLSKFTEMRVTQVEDGMAVSPNVVHIIPPNTSLTIQEGRLILAEPLGKRGTRMPIDHFLASLSKERQEAAIGIILSGTGADGTYGVREIKARGGTTIVQEPASAQFNGMPLNSIATGVVDYVLRPDEIAELVARYTEHLASSQHGRPLEKSENQDLSAILSLLLARQGYDFSSYKRGTLVRRIRRRMGLKQIETLAEYQALLNTDREEEEALARDLLIGVTSFFRDLEAWETLAMDILPELLKREHHNGAIRVWVPGCATGEEAYTLAMLITEAAERRGKRITPVIFATDIALDALETARAGRYPEAIKADVSPERLQRFFAREGDQYIIKPELRDLVIFAPQNLITDPPFSRLDLISCRNLLIYIDTAYQNRIMALFHFALVDGGYLMLGSSETIGSSQTLFRPLSKKWRLFRRIDTSRPRQLPAMHDPRQVTRQLNAPAAAPRVVNFGQLAQRMLMQLFAPAAVLIDADQLIQYYYGRVYDYLSQSTGEPTTQLLSLAGEVLRVKLRTLIQQATNQQQPVTVSGVQLQRGDTWHSVRLSAYPIQESGAPPGMMLITFSDEAETTLSAGIQLEAPEEQATLVDQLKEELTHTRQELHNTIEQMETSNEELKASNEEVLSMNEELQSSNEELETSKEELQSLNEELITLNSQLEEKVRELEEASDDMHNLLDSSDIATLFVDRDFRIRRFTPAITQLLKLIDSDVGRHLTDIVWRFNDDNLVEEMQRILTGESCEGKLIHAENEHWYMRRLFPYKTGSGLVKGVVLTFVDITDRRAYELDLREKEQYLKRITDATPGLISYIDRDECYRFNNAMYRTWFGVEPEELIGMAMLELKGGDVYQYIKPRIDQVLSGQSVDFDFILPQTLLGCRYVHASYIPDTDTETGEVKGFFSLLTDVTERTEYEQQIQALNNSLSQRVEEQETLFAAAPIGIFVARDPNCADMSMNAAGAELLRINLGDNPSLSSKEAAHLPFRVYQNDLPVESDKLPLQKAAKEGKIVKNEEIEIRFDDGERKIISVHAAPLYDNNKIRGCIGVMVDTTAYHHALDELAEADQRKDRFVALLAHELRNPLTALVIAADLMESHEAEPMVVEHVREALRNQTRHLSRLVDDLLDVARITQDQLELQCQTVDLRTALSDALHTVESEMQERHHEFDYFQPENALWVFGDPTRLTQVFSNLLKNAAIYTPDNGRISLTVTDLGREIKVAIEDTGSGLSAKDLENIFEPLERSNDSRSASQGLGLGLPLAKRIAELHSGRIEAYSTGRGQGSRFTVYLPAHDVGQTGTPPQATAMIKGERLRILIVDDEPSITETLALLLKLQGHTTEVVDHPDKVIPCIEAFQPQVVLLDIGLPQRSGFEVATDLNALPQRDGMRVIALSGHVDKIGAQWEDQEADVFDGKLLKPVTESQLLEALYPPDKS